MPNLLSSCPCCEGNELYTHTIDSDGYLGPNLLPGLGGLWRNPKFNIVVCQECGHTQFFVDPQSLDKLPNTKGWRRISSQD
jgi:predicted nucleic-acid-binding Zn-ribbon protein